MIFEHMFTSNIRFPGTHNVYRVFFGGVAVGEGAPIRKLTYNHVYLWWIYLDSSRKYQSSDGTLMFIYKLMQVFR